MSRIMRLQERWTAVGGRDIERDLVEQDWPGYYDWAARRADIRFEADRAPAVPQHIADDVAHGNPAALLRLGMRADEVEGPEDVTLPQEAVELALMRDPVADPLAGARQQ
eukprot:3786067-Alexandrium_andersonii.AAC.1